eukprot:Anaeramoba_flamelloidesa90699_145.p1 GENE.a90699_145~~a90699_145.p1  ORF type:complete len:686 (-),score=151.54 a90699_145:41-2098(-)
MENEDSDNLGVLTETSDSSNDSDSGTGSGSGSDSGSIASSGSGSGSGSGSDSDSKSNESLSDFKNKEKIDNLMDKLEIKSKEDLNEENIKIISKHIIKEEENESENENEKQIDSEGKKKTKLEFNYYKNIINDQYKSGKDFYAVCFFIDFFTFVYLAFNYQNLSKTSNYNLSGYLQTESMIPISFALILMGQFTLIVVDRVIYLYRAITLKLIYQIVSVFLHLLIIFIILPYNLDTTFGKKSSFIFLYIIKSIYFLFSSLQIQYGYPEYTKGNLFMKKFSSTNSQFYSVYKLIPFLYELRMLLDWLCTKTSLDFFEFLKIHDIKASLFCKKCELLGEDEEELTEEEKNKPLLFKEKAKTGLTLFILLSLLLFLPILLMSKTQDTEVNYINSMKIQVGIKGYSPFFQYSTITSHKTINSNKEIEIMCKDFKGSLDSKYFQSISISNYSDSFWSITPPKEEQLRLDLATGVATTLQIIYEFETEVASGPDSTITRSYTHQKTLSDSETNDLAELLNSNGDGSVSFHNFLPLIVNLPRNNEVEDICDQYIDTIMILQGINSSQSNSENDRYWGLTTARDTTIYFYARNPDLPEGGLGAMAMSSGGVIGLYVGIVFSVGRFLRMYVNDISLRIMYDDLPNVDFLYDLIQSLFWCQKEKFFYLEKQFYYHIIDIYRSTEKLIYFTGLFSK